MNKLNTVTIGIFLSIFGNILFENIANASPINPSILKRDFENDDFKGQLPVENREEQARLGNTGLEQDNRMRGDLMEGREGVSSKSAQVGELLPSRIQEGVGESNDVTNHQDGSQTDPGPGQQVDIHANSRDVPHNQEQHSVSVPGHNVQDLNLANLVRSDSTQQPQAQQTVQSANQNHDQFSSQQPLTNQGSDQQLPLHGPDQKLPLLQGSNQQLPLQQGSNQHLPLEQGSNQHLPLEQGSNKQVPLQQDSNKELPLQDGSNQQLPNEQGSNQQLPLQEGSDQHLPLQQSPDQQLPLQQGSNQHLPLQQGLNQQLSLQQGSDQHLPLQQGLNQQLPLQQGSDQHLPLQQGSDQHLPLQQGSNQHLPLQQGLSQQLPLQQGSDQHLPLQQGSDQQLPLQQGSNQQLPLQQGSDQHLPPQQNPNQQHPLQQGSDQHLPLQHGSNQQLPLQQSVDQSVQTHVSSQHLPHLQGSEQVSEDQQYHYGSEQQAQGEMTRGNQREASPNQNQVLDKTQNGNSNSDQTSFLQLALQDKLQSDVLKDGTKETGNDVPQEFKVEDNEPLDGSNDPAAQSKDRYSDDGYLDPPANNLDADRSLSDKSDDEVAHNANAYDEDGEADTRINNKNIIDDNNEQAVYNGDNNGGDTEGEHTDDNDEKDQGFDDDYDDYSYEDKEDNDGLGQEASKPSTSSTPTKDDWYGDSKEEDGDDDGVDGVLDKEDEDYSDPDIDQELEFQQMHQKVPHIDSKGEEFVYEDTRTNFKEGVVENKLLKNRVGLNAPSSMVLFYTWIILIVLIAVVSLSAFRYRCKGLFMNGPRNFRNGNHGNYRPGEENKRLLENVYT